MLLSGEEGAASSALRCAAGSACASSRVAGCLGAWEWSVPGASASSDTGRALDGTGLGASLDGMEVFSRYDTNIVITAPSVQATTYRKHRTLQYAAPCATTVVNAMRSPTEL